MYVYVACAYVCIISMHVCMCEHEYAYVYTCVYACMSIFCRCARARPYCLDISLQVYTPILSPGGGGGMRQCSKGVIIVFVCMCVSVV